VVAFTLVPCNRDEEGVYVEEPYRPLPKWEGWYEAELTLKWLGGWVVGQNLGQPFSEGLLAPRSWEASKNKGKDKAAKATPLKNVWQGSLPKTFRTSSVIGPPHRWVAAQQPHQQPAAHVVVGAPGAAVMQAQASI
jgi:hypothetical protein